jgi:hypothetical protein
MAFLLAITLLEPLCLAQYQQAMQLGDSSMTAKLFSSGKPGHYAGR